MEKVLLLLLHLLDAVKLFEMVIGVFSLEACSVLPSASPSSPEGWERDWEESLVPPLGWQPAPVGPKECLIPSFSSRQSKRTRGAAQGAGAEG